MESIGRLAGGVAHDFNNMLSAILGFASVAREELAATDPVRDDLDQVVEAAQRAGRLTSQLLAFGRRQLLSPARFEIDDLVGEVTRLLRRVVPEVVSLTVLKCDKATTVMADRVQIEQVLVNLVINACDAMPAGGALRISTRVDAAGPDGGGGGEWIVLAVDDTGTGMDEDTLRHAFEPFFTTKPVGRGTGLGLSTAYGIVEQSGGRLIARSELGRGSTLEVWLPRVQATPAARPDHPAPSRFLAGQGTVLVVEDEALVRRLVVQVLQRAGYSVLEAAHPGEALLVSERHAGPIHLLLSDLVMPLMGGAELWERLRGERPETKVLFTSGHAEIGAGEPSAAELLRKPFAPSLLLERVRDVLEG